MKPQISNLKFQISVYLCSSAVSFLILGCGKPNQANIELRKQIQDLESQIASLRVQHEADAATIRGLEQRGGEIPTLPQDRLEQLFTVHGIRIGRLSGGVDLDPSKPGDEALKVYVAPVDQHGDPIKAAGSFVVEAFDLSLPADNRLGKWEFPLEQAEKYWVGELLMYTYVLTCPWQVAPQTDQVTVRVTFGDALTGREFVEQKVVRVVPGPSTLPATPG
jgi:hypothetical protein